MKQFITIALTVFSFVCFAQEKTIIKDRNAQVRNVGSFTGISVSSAIELLITQGNPTNVVVSADEDKYRDNIKTEVRNGTLHIFYENHGFNWNIGNHRMKAYVSFNTLHNLEVSGASSCKINGTIDQPELTIKMSGASSMNGDMKIGNLNFEGSGASNAKVTGSAAKMVIHVSGASDFKSYDFIADNCTARATGASDIRITVNKELSVDASGASSINYKGSPAVRELHSSGASSVSKKS